MHFTHSHVFQGMTPWANVTCFCPARPVMTAMTLLHSHRVLKLHCTVCCEEAPKSEQAGHVQHLYLKRGMEDSHPCPTNTYSACCVWGEHVVLAKSMHVSRRSKPASSLAQTKPHHADSALCRLGHTQWTLTHDTVSLKHISSYMVRGAEAQEHWPACKQHHRQT